MAKASKKKPAKKTAAKKSAKKRKKITSADVQLSPKERAKVLKKLKKLSLPPSHPSSITGPALTLGYDAPLPSEKVKTRKKATRPAKKKKK
jgi:hypothetical protein